MSEDNSSDDSDDSFEGLPIGRGALWGSWSLVGRHENIMAATTRVSLTSESGNGVEDAVTYCADEKSAAYIYVYSGVHGAPGGIIELDEPDFHESDVSGLEQNENGLEIKVRLFTMQDGRKSIPAGLWQDINKKGAFVVLAWCYSEDFFKNRKTVFDGATPPANLITNIPKDGQPIPLARGGFALPARKIGGRRYRTKR